MNAVLTVYRYTENSCYLDTLLLIIFNNLSKKWVNAMILVAYQKSDFKPLLCKERLSLEATITYAEKLRKILSDEYNKMHSYSSIFLKCTDVRSSLVQCIPNIKQGQKYVPYNVGEIYNLFAGLYPGLNIDIPYVIKDKGKITTRDIMTVPSFTMWEFMEDNQDGKEYLWDEVTSDILVFQYTGVPAIVNLGSLESEKSIVKIGEQIYETIANKKRIFSEAILDERYRLVGAIILQGYIPGTESGIHYVGYFVDPSGDYYYYNDIGPQIIKLDEYPETIWKYDNYNMPFMYLYARIA